MESTRAECIFTTHTPVEAGHDRFSADLLDYAMHRFRNQLPVGFSEVTKLGRVNPQDSKEPFCMTVLALKLSRTANAVSELHGRVSRHMWNCLYPGTPVDQVPIGHITNGIHLLGWMKGTVRRFWRAKLAGSSRPRGGDVVSQQAGQGAGWISQINSPEFWQRLADPQFISDEELWALRYKLRRELIEFARRRLLIQGQRLTHGDFIAFDHLLNPDALTIGFARRFATYKRAPLIFQQFDNIVRLAHDPARPSPIHLCRQGPSRATMTASATSSTSFTSANTAACKGAWCFLRTMTCTSRARWSPAAMCGSTLPAARSRPPAPAA